MKTKEMEQHAIQVSDYLKQSQEVKTSYLILKKKFTYTLLWLLDCVCFTFMFLNWLLLFIGVTFKSLL